MDGQIHPEHECERCGCESVSRHADPEDGAEFELCNRCQWVLGSELAPLDEIIGALWVSHDIHGMPYPEDIHAAMQEQQTTDETYEVREPLTSIELDEAYDRSVRMQEAMDVIQECTPGPPENDMDPRDDLYDPGPQIYLP